MNLAPLKTRRTLHCPACSATLLEILPHAIGNSSDEFWLDDGDTVPGVRDALRALSPAGGAEAMLSVGRCADCEHGYYAVEIVTVDGGHDALLEWFAGEWELRGAEHLEASLGEESWPVFRTTTTSGREVYEHLLGPFAADVDALRGPAGVASCGTLAKQAPWQHARDLVNRIAPQIAAPGPTAHAAGTRGAIE